MSAAGAIILTLALVIVALIGLPIGGVILWQWLQDRQQQRKLDKARAQAEIYAALQGAQQRPPTAARPRARSYNWRAVRTILRCFRPSLTIGRASGIQVHADSGSTSR